MAVVVPALTLTNPSGLQIQAGIAFSEVNQEELAIIASDRAVLHWENFSIGARETTTFYLPSSEASVLNRVVSGSCSEILGCLKSNGSVFLINPNGILIGKEGVVQTAAFLASTLDITDSVFLNGDSLIFEGSSQEKIVNLGSIESGEVSFFGLHVENQGKICAQNVKMAGGSGVVISPEKGSRIWIAPKAEGSIQNSGVIEALQVEIAAYGGPYSLAVNHTGVIDASSFVNEKGRVFLLAQQGGVAVSGTVKAPLGFVEVSGSYFVFQSGVDTQGPDGQCGKLFLDPNDILISSAPTNPAPFSGTFFDGAGVASSTLNTTELINALSLNNVTIQTHAPTSGGSGDISFLNPLIWNSPNSLSVVAERDVNVLTLVKNSGTGGINITSGRDLNVGSASGTGPCQVGSRGGDMGFSIGGAINILGGSSPDAFAQIGYDATSIMSNLIFSADVDALNVIGGSGARAFALIGHGGYQSLGGVKTGNIIFNSGEGGLTIRGGSGTDAFAQIGIVRGKTGAVMGSGDVIVSYLASSTIIEGGTGARSYALFGHGGGDGDQSCIFSGDIKLYTQSGIIHGHALGSFAGAGYYTYASDYAVVSNTANLIDITVPGPLTIQADDGAEAYVGAYLSASDDAAGSLTIQKINIETGALSVSGMVPSGGLSNFAGIGAWATTGTAACVLKLKSSTDLILISGGTGSNVGIQNGTGSPAGSWTVAINVNNSAVLEGATGSAKISSIGALTLNAADKDISLNGAASITAAKELTLFAGQDLSLAGVAGGSSAFIQTAADNLKISTGNLLTVNSNAYLRNLGTNNGRIILNAGSDLSIIGAAAFIENLGNNATWLCALRDINVYAAIQNAGTGRFVLNAVRDINVGHAASQIPCQIGTALGTPINIISTRNLNVIGGSGLGAYAQIGADAVSVASDINLLEVSGDIVVQGGSGSGAFAAIGHGRLNGFGGAKTGNILIAEANGDFLIQGGSGANAYAQVGHCHGTGSAAALTGNVQAKEIGGYLHIYGGSGSNAYALFGHGGSSFTAGDSYTGIINASAQEVAIIGGSQASAPAGLGFTNGKTGAAGAITVSSTQIFLQSKTNLTIQAGSQAYGFVGASLDTAAPSSVSITTIIADAGETLLLTGSTVSANASADLGLVNANGTCGTNLVFCNQGDLTVSANMGGVNIRNGTGFPAGSFVWYGSSRGAVSYNGMAVTAVGDLFIEADTLTLASSSFLSSGSLTTLVVSDTTLTSSSLENSHGTFAHTSGGDLTLGANCFFRNHEGSLSILANNLSITGAGAFIHNLGSGDYTLNATGDFILNATLQNPGTGFHSISVGRDLIIGTAGDSLDGRLEAPSGSLSVITGRHLTLTASSGHEASLLSGGQMTLSIGADATLNGVISGGQAFIQAGSASSYINTGNDLVLNPNAFIRHQGGSDGDLSFDVRQDFKITAATGANSFVYNLGSGALDYNIHRDFIVNATIQNPGSGDITIFTGRDFLLGKSTNTIRAHFGSVTGNLKATVIGNLSVLAGNTNNAFAQLGGQAAVSISSDITVTAVGGNLNLIANSATNAFAQIGNRSLLTIFGTVDVGEVGGTVTITPGGGLTNYAEIGNQIGGVIPSAPFH